jgi:hypothetical protein
MRKVRGAVVSYQRNLLARTYRVSDFDYDLLNVGIKDAESVGPLEDDNASSLLPEYTRNIGDGIDVNRINESIERREHARAPPDPIRIIGSATQVERRTLCACTSTETHNDTIGAKRVAEPLQLPERMFEANEVWMRVRVQSY